MKLEKAIEIETIHNDHNLDYTDAEREQAHQLGIEALKRLQSNRKYAFSITFTPLPGETK